MFKDINIFLDDEQTNYTYEIKNEEIIFSLNIDIDYNNLDLVYDENIYEKIIFIEEIPFQKISAGKLRIDSKNISSKEFIFKVEINYKYFIKTIYKFINNFINKNELLEELNIFKNSKMGKKYKNQINTLINEINEISLNDLLLTSDNEKDKIDNLLSNNELYLSLVKKMTDKDLMLLVTYYISCNKPPKINQETFDNLVNAAINYDYSLENVWRLGMNYDRRGYNYDLLDNFFVNSKDAWYLSEYLTGIDQTNEEKIINMVIKTNDKTFIGKLIEDNFIQIYLEDKYKEILEIAFKEQ